MRAHVLRFTSARRRWATVLVIRLEMMLSKTDAKRAAALPLLKFRH